MTGHLKSTLVGASLAVPVIDGKLALPRGQTVWLCEHRNSGGWGGGHNRKIVINAIPAQEDAQGSLQVECEAAGPMELAEEIVLAALPAIADCKVGVVHLQVSGGAAIAVGAQGSDLGASLRHVLTAAGVKEPSPHVLTMFGGAGVTVSVRGGKMCLGEGRALLLTSCLGGEVSVIATLVA